jgi:hypothetical protein
MTGKTMKQLVGCVHLWNFTVWDFHLFEDFAHLAPLHSELLFLLFSPISFRSLWGNKVPLILSELPSNLASLF